MKRTCKQCGAEFMLSENEIAFYRNKNLHLPKRCENCRRENRKTDGDSAVRQEIKPYYKKDGNKIGRLAAAAAVCLLLAVVIGAFRAGWLFEAAWSGQGDGVSAETVADASVAVDTTPERWMMRRRGFLMRWMILRRWFLMRRIMRRQRFPQRWMMLL